MRQKLLMVCLVCGTAIAQGPGKEADPSGLGPGEVPRMSLPPSGKPLPKMSNGKPDLSGMWVGGLGLITGRLARGAGGGSGQPPEAPPYKLEFLPRVSELGKNNAADPGVNCFLLGTPRVTAWPFPFKIVQSPKEVIILYEAMRTFRDIPTDGRGHTPDPENTFMGESIGRWEGDTLVVDTVGFNDKTYLVGGGTIHSQDLHVVERYSPTADGRIRYEAIAEDPKMLTRPWKVLDGLLNPATGPDVISEYECIEGNRDVEHLLKAK